MSEKRHKINTVANNQKFGIIERNNPAFDRHDFCAVPKLLIFVTQICWLDP